MDLAQWRTESNQIKIKSKTNHIGLFFGKGSDLEAADVASLPSRPEPWAPGRWSRIHQSGRPRWRVWVSDQKLIERPPDMISSSSWTTMVVVDMADENDRSRLLSPLALSPMSPQQPLPMRTHQAPLAPSMSSAVRPYTRRRGSHAHNNFCEQRGMKLWKGEGREIPRLQYTAYITDEPRRGMIKGSTAFQIHRQSSTNSLPCRPKR
jgi:hypothetical protein